jgi:CspA family cold shock protein
MNGEVVATVSEWRSEEGWGRVTVEGSGDEVWTHFSAIEGRASGSLHVGERVRLWYRPGPRPAHFEAMRVIPTLDDGSGAAEARPPGDAYRSSLTVTYDSD